jgi:hypothetical protein
MPIGLTVNNPQEENPVAAVSPTVTTGGVTYGGNALGAGASTSTTTSDISTILLYGAIGLAAVFLFQRLED